MLRSVKHVLAECNLPTRLTAVKTGGNAAWIVCHMYVRVRHGVGADTISVAKRATKTHRLVRSMQIIGGRYWDRTSGFHRVKVALYR